MLRFEVIQKTNDHPLKKCPKCGGTLAKVFSPPALQFKGNGWYITDYAPKTKPEEEVKTKEKPKSEKANPSKKDDRFPSTE